MFSFISFALKLCFAAFFGGVIAYTPGRARDEKSILYSSLISVVASALMGISVQVTDNAFGFIAGGSIIAVLLSVVLLTQKMEFEKRLMFLFSGICGLLSGASYILHAGVFTILVYLIYYKGEHLLEHIEPTELVDEDQSLENIKK